MSQIQIFDNPEFGKVTTAVIDGKEYIEAVPCAKALGYADPGDAIRRHCPHVVKHRIGVETGKKADGTPAIQMVEKSFIPEGDLFRLIINSRLPSAERFERWVFDIVLPTIRKTGGYNISGDYLVRRLEAVEAELFAARKIIDFHENSDDVFDFDYVAAAISKYMKPPFGVKHLCQWLVQRGVLTHRAYKNDKPRQEYINQGWFEPRNHTWRQRGKCRHSQTYWFTARGLNGVIRMAIEEKMLLLPTPAQTIFPVLIGHDGSRRIG